MVGMQEYLPHKLSQVMRKKHTPQDAVISPSPDFLIKQHMSRNVATLYAVELESQGQCVGA